MREMMPTEELRNENPSLRSISYTATAATDTRICISRTSIATTTPGLLNAFLNKLYCRREVVLPRTEALMAV